MDSSAATPRARPLLKFANRVYTSSPQNGNGSKRFASPIPSPSRRLLNRDDLPSSSLNQSSIDAARNIFRASTITNGSSVRFDPSLPPGTMKKSFASNSTPDSKRVFRESVSRPTPRGMMAKTTSADLFAMRIPSPPPELTGEVLAKKIPQDLSQKGTVYAEQYLSHLCPKEFDELQRRQFFCILDLRRLKYAANEIFAKKDWKLNVMNFAKEFEKSRSLIMLRYGLYEFKNVKPSEEILKKWRAAHGLPDTEDAATTPSKLPPSRPTAATATKRKAEDDLPKDGALSTSSANKNKRRAVDTEDKVTAAATSLKNKRKASVTDEPDENQPSKVQKTTPSATKSLFEKIAANAASASPSVKSAPAPGSAPTKPTPKQPSFGSTLKPNPFAPSSKATNGSLARSVLDGGLKPGPSQGSSANIFGYLSDASSAKNSGVDADGESETDSEPDTEPQDAGQSYEPSVAASGGADTPSSQLGSFGSGLFAKKQTPFGSGLATGPSSTSSEARESTPGRSIFDRITKGTDGQPVRFLRDEKPPAEPLKNDTPAEPQSVEGETKSVPANKTWTPDTPIKFGAPSAQSMSVPAPAPSTTSSSIFAPKPVSSSNLFGAPQRDAAPEKPAAPPQQTAGEADRPGEESDKENVSQPVPKTASLFSVKNAEAIPPPPPAAITPPEANKEVGESGAEPDTNGQSSAPSEKSEPSAERPTVTSPKASETQSEKPQAPSLFSFGSQPQAKPQATPISESTTLFGNKSTEPTKSLAPAEAPKPPGLFAFSGAASSAGTNLFSNKPTESSNIFGAKPASAPTAAPLPTFSFGQAPAKDEPKPAETPKSTSRPMFGAGTSSNHVFGGSPMKQDEPSPAKRTFGDAMQQDGPSPAKRLFGGNDTNSASPFKFGASQTSTPSLFAPATQPPSATQPPVMFGGAGGIDFNFTAGGGNQGFNNPFASGGTDGGASPATGGLFNFGATAPTQPTSSGGSFVFNAAGSSATPAPASANPFAFTSGGRSSTPSGPGKRPHLGSRPGLKPAFGHSSAATATQQTNFFGAQANSTAPSAAPTFNFTSASPQPQPTQDANPFAPKLPTQAPSLFGNLQLPGGGTSTGTNSPFNFGGASSLATTPVNGTPEPNTDAEAAGSGAAAEDGDAEAVHKQINLTEGGPGEEDETIVHEVRAKVLRFVVPGQGSDSDEKAKSKSPWSVQGVGPLRLLKHKTTGAVRVLLRKEPGGQVALNRAILPNVDYKANEKYVKLTTSAEVGSGLETWMLQVKTKEAAKALAEALEANKGANKG